MNGLVEKLGDLAAYSIASTDEGVNYEEAGFDLLEPPLFSFFSFLINNASSFFA